MTEKYACILAKTNNPTYAGLIAAKGNHTPYTLVRGCEQGVEIVTPERYVSSFEKLLKNRGIEDTIL